MKRRDFLAGLVANAAVGVVRAAGTSRVYRIAFVYPSGSPSALYFDELRRLGYVEGDNLEVLRFSADGDSTRFDSLIRDALNADPDVIFAVSSRLALRLKAATSTIPIVAAMANPVGFGIVTSLARPGGNITGVSADAGPEVWGKRLQMLLEVIPNATRVSFLASDSVWKLTGKTTFLDAARQLSIPVVGSPLKAILDEAEYRRAFQTMEQAQTNGLVVSDQQEHVTKRHLIVELAERYRLPTIYPSRDFVDVGGLMAYAFDRQNIAFHTVAYIDFILKGKKPSELPIYETDKFTTIINLKTARTLGLTIPATLLASADEVIE